MRKRPSGESFERRVEECEDENIGKMDEIFMKGM